MHELNITIVFDPVFGSNLLLVPDDPTDIASSAGPIPNSGAPQQKLLFYLFLVLELDSLLSIVSSTVHQ